MRAAVFYASGEPLRLEDVPVPQVGDGEILIDVAACGLCHSDLHYIDHGVPTFKKPPLILGHEAAGIVVDKGKAVTNFELGDRVLMPAVLSCGACRYCWIGRHNICPRGQMPGNDIDGAFAEFVKAPAAQCFKLPEEIPLVEGCVIADALTTPYHAVVDRARVQPGELVLVMGCGGVGLNAVQIANVMGAHVIGVDLSEERLEWARRFGAAETINPAQDPDYLKSLRRRTDGGVDVAIEAIGTPGTQQQAFNTVRPGGRVLFLGYSDKEVALNASRIMYREMEVMGTLGCPPSGYRQVIELVRQGRLEVKALVTQRFSLEDINPGLDALRASRGVRSVVIP
ncbi:MAG: zinc-binding dehydrogenase [Chloroflexota bacterium]|nr:zinc-binding dehydrogenase [Chloroflexota bacterium]